MPLSPSPEVTICQHYHISVGHQDFQDTGEDSLQWIKCISHKLQIPMLFLKRTPFQDL